VDLTGIRNRLDALGVTLRFQSDPPNIADLLQDQRQYRAALYIDRLEDARTFLVTALSGPLPPVGHGLTDYGFVETALDQAELINQLAAGLDEWICPAVEAAVNAAIAAGGVNAPTDYQTWFTRRIFDPVNATYNANVAGFFAQYPITGHALTQIQNNFQNNIETALRRMLLDRARITLLFSDRYNGLTLTGLDQITTTGSDYHKGGQQVLILTFSIRYWSGYRNWVPNFSTLKLVYKPADVEIDCLVAGEAAAVNRATGNPGFLVQSLTEIFNAWIAAHAAPGLEALPTYRILPRFPVSQAVGGPPYPVRQAYGYLEYLGYAFTGETWGAFNYYPLGESDYVIFEQTPAAPIIARFYRQAGEFLALAVAFSLVDLHVENVRATTYQPHLIDLEASLTANITSVLNTLLLDAQGANMIGGFNGDSRSNEDFVFEFAVSAHNAPQWQVSQTFITKWYANRLWAMRQWAKRLVPVDVFYLLQGLNNGMNMIQAMQNDPGVAGFAARLAAWLGRANNVLVRILPVATDEWGAVRFGIYATTPQLSGPPALPVALAPTVNRAYLGEVTNLWFQAPGPEPKYAAAAAAQVATDLTNFDIPTFYHRVGSAELLDSMGAIIPWPLQVTILNNAQPPVGVQVNTNRTRTTYFAPPSPTTARVVARLALIGAGGFAGAVPYQVQTLTAFGLVAPPVGPTVVM
jgi:hypothetical protein